MISVTFAKSLVSCVKFFQRVSPSISHRVSIQLISFLNGWIASIQPPHTQVTGQLQEGGDAQLWDAHLASDQ